MGKTFRIREEFNLINDILPGKVLGNGRGKPDLAKFISGGGNAIIGSSMP